jgi:hypothetical protein
VKLVGKVPVEPLDDERLVHIERRVVANAQVTPPARGWLPQVTRHLVPLAISAAAIAVAIAVGWMLRGVPELGGASPQLAAAPAAESPVRMHGGSLDIGDATIASSAETDYEVTRPNGGVLVALARGLVELHVGKRGSRPPLVVRAGDTDVVVVGTRFSVAWDGSGPVEVRVTEGVVRCVRAGIEARVAAGEEWRSDAGVVAMATAPASAAGGATATTTTATAIEIDGGDEPLRGHGATAPETHPRLDGSATATAAARRSVGSDDSKDPQHDLKTEIRNVALLPAVEVPGKADAAALDAYRDTWSSKFDDGAEHALYSAALVSSLRLGHDDDARTLLELYVRRFATKRDDVTAAAFWLRVRILCLHALDDRCRAAAAAYTAHGGGPAEHVVELISATQ